MSDIIKHLNTDAISHPNEIVPEVKTEVFVRVTVEAPIASMINFAGRMQVLPRDSFGSRTRPIADAIVNGIIKPDDSEEPAQ